jgi:hypothetical protein
MLSDQMTSLLQDACSGAFSQQRSRVRAMELSLGTLCALGRRTLSRSICAVGRQHRDWSADYKVFSRSQWEPDQLFTPVLKEYLTRNPADQPVCLAFDDTKLSRSGRKIKSAFWQRDPLSPPFHVNFMYGLRFMHASLIFPHYRDGDFSARGYPVRFVECPAVKKPGKKATAEERVEYKRAVKTHNLSQQGLGIMKGLRVDLDRLGETTRKMVVAVDGSLCNRTILSKPLDRVEVVGRCRKDARLCFPAPEGGRRKYSEEQDSFRRCMARHSLQRVSQCFVAKRGGTPPSSFAGGCPATVQDICECQKELPRSGLSPEHRHSKRCPDAVAMLF